MSKTASQVLFDRIIRTWIDPAITARRTADPGVGAVPLYLALIVWKTETKTAQVSLNDEVHDKVRRLDVITAGPVQKGQAVTPADIKGIGSLALDGTLSKCPYVFIVQGKESAFYVASSRMSTIAPQARFDVLARPLATEGVHLSGEANVSIFLDVIKNGYESCRTPAQKRKEFRRLTEGRIASAQDRARPEVRRLLRVPAIIIHPEEFLPLLLEARATYVSGQFFSCIASAVTTADRICIRLMYRYDLPAQDQTKALGMTFGQKIQFLRARGLVEASQETVLRKLNGIRTRHVHARQAPTTRATERDALRSIRLLHEFVEGTFSVFRDYTIEHGRLSPKPLS